MSVPYGYKMINGKLEVDEYQKKIVQFIHELFLLELTEDGITVHIDTSDINLVFNKFNVPKTQTEGYEIEDYKQKIKEYCHGLLKEKLSEKLEQLKED